MASISYFLVGTKLYKKIYVRVRGKGMDLQASTNFIIMAKDWNIAKKYIYNPKMADIKELKELLDDFNATLVSYMNKYDTITLQELKGIINPLKTQDKDFYYYVVIYCENINYRNKQRFDAVCKLLDKYMKYKGISTVYCIDFNEALFLDYIKFLKTLNYSLNYIYSSIKFIKTICYHAEYLGEEISKQVRGFKIKIIKHKPIYLTFAEIDKIKKTELNGYLSNARDWLVLSCYTGQRVSDFLRFEKGMVKELEGKNYIEFEQTKTKKKMFLPIHKEVQVILDKNKGNFPNKISDQKYNLYIKEVCLKAGFFEKIEGSKNINNRNVLGIYQKYELITSHIGRRSFATNFYGIIPTSLIMVATGHTTEKMLLTYIGKVDTEQFKNLGDYF